MHGGLGARRLGREGQGEGDLRIGDAQVVDQAERDDIPLLLRIAHRSQCVEDGLLSDHTRDYTPRAARLCPAILALSSSTCYKKRVISADEFRRTLSHFASGVTVITTCDRDGRPTGLTASAFTSVSLEPPLILVCVDNKAQSYPALLAGKMFAVNILGLEQEVVSRRFATTKIENKFEGVPFTLSPLGLPLLDNALAQLGCATVNVHLEGDHTIFVGRVEGASAGPGAPLVYFRGRYERLSGPTT